MPPRTSPRAPARLLALFFVAAVSAAAVSAAGASRTRPTFEDLSRSVDARCSGPRALRCQGDDATPAMPAYAAQRAELERAARFAASGDATNAKEAVARVLGHAAELDRRGGFLAHVLSANLTRRALALVKAHERLFDDAFVVHAFEAAPSTTGEVALDEDTLAVEKRVTGRVTSSPWTLRQVLRVLVPFDVRALEARRRAMRSAVAQGDAAGCAQAASDSVPLFDGPGPGAERMTCASAMEMSRTHASVVSARAIARGRLQAGAPR